MTSGTFDEREQALENKYMKDEEARFGLNAQAVRLFALWAAAQLGIGSEGAKKYADSLTDVHVTKKGLQHVIAKVRADLSARGIEASEHHLGIQFDLHLAEARKTWGK